MKLTFKQFKDLLFWGTVVVYLLLLLVMVMFKVEDRYAMYLPWGLMVTIAVWIVTINPLYRFLTRRTKHEES